MKPLFTGCQCVYVWTFGHIVMVLSHLDVCIQRSSDSNGGTAGESLYVSRKETSLHFFLFSDLVLFARLTGELVWASRMVVSRGGLDQ